MVLDDETGQCIPESQTAALAAYREARSTASVTQSTFYQDEAMMGFTFAPPRVRWGIFYKEELDLLFVTITLFEVKAGVDFGLGVGFRLPAEVTVSNLPGASIMAESSVDLQTKIMPRDFTVQDYTDFCLTQDPPMGNAAYCS
ncbi:MAG: hypothetical protein GWN97_02995, partial [Thermoplasmata archaeon]|nr:hypothetical protein [Thermoplasmata archaeon]